MTEFLRVLNFLDNFLINDVVNLHSDILDECKSLNVRICKVEDYLQNISLDVSTIDSNVSSIDTNINNMDNNVYFTKSDVETIDRNVSNMDTYLFNIDLKID